MDEASELQIFRKIERLLNALKMHGAMLEGWMAKPIGLDDDRARFCGDCDRLSAETGDFFAGKDLSYCTGCWACAHSLREEYRKFQNAYNCFRNGVCES